MSRTRFCVYDSGSAAWVHSDKDPMDQGEADAVRLEAHRNGWLRLKEEEFSRATGPNLHERLWGIIRANGNTFLYKFFLIGYDHHHRPGRHMLMVARISSHADSTDIMKLIYDVLIQTPLLSKSYTRGEPQGHLEQAVKTEADLLHENLRHVARADLHRCILISGSTVVAVHEPSYNASIVVSDAHRPSTVVVDEQTHGPGDDQSKFILDGRRERKPQRPAPAIPTKNFSRATIIRISAILALTTGLIVIVVLKVKSSTARVDENPLISKEPLPVELLEKHHSKDYSTRLKYDNQNSHAFDTLGNHYVVMNSHKKEDLVAASILFSESLGISDPALRSESSRHPLKLVVFADLSRHKLSTITIRKSDESLIVIRNPLTEFEVAPAKPNRGR